MFYGFLHASPLNNSAMTNPLDRRYLLFDPPALHLLTTERHDMDRCHSCFCSYVFSAFSRVGFGCMFSISVELHALWVSNLSKLCFPNTASIISCNRVSCSFAVRDARILFFAF
jgi:hypothetical protein